MNNHSNTRRRAIAIATLALTGLVAAPAAQAFGLDKALGSIKSVSAPVDLNGFMKSVATAEGLMNESLVALLSAVGAKEKAAELKSALEAAAKISDAKDKNAQQTEAIKDGLTKFQEQTAGDKLKNDIEKMASEQRAQLGAAAFNFSLAMLQDRALLEQSKAVVSSVSANPAQLAQLGNVQAAVGGLTNQLEVGGKIAGLMPVIFSAVGVKAPTSKDDKPKQTRSVDM